MRSAEVAATDEPNAGGAKVVAGATVSLDGFVQDADGSYSARYADDEELVGSAYMRGLQEETGAVLMGRRTYDLAEAAGERAATFIGGADVFRQLLAAGLVDELAIDVMPVVFGGGAHLFDDVGPCAVREKMSVEEVDVRTCLRYRVVRAAASDQAAPG